MSYYYSPTTGMPMTVGGVPVPAGSMPMSASGMPMPSDRSRMYAPVTPGSLQAMQSAGSYAQQQACASAGIAASAYRQQVAIPGYPPNTIAYAPGYTTASPYQLSTGPYPTASMAQLSGTTATGYASAYSMPAVAHANMYPYSQYRGVPMSSHTAAAVAYQQQQAMPQPYPTAAQIQRPTSSYSPTGAQPTGATYPAGAYARGMPPL